MAGVAQSVVFPPSRHVTPAVRAANEVAVAVDVEEAREGVRPASPNQDPGSSDDFSPMSLNSGAGVVTKASAPISIAPVAARAVALVANKFQAEVSPVVVTAMEVVVGKVKD